MARASQHKAFHFEICTADGIVVMDLGGVSDQDAPQGHDHAGFCLACHGLPQAVLPDSPAVPMPTQRAVAAPHARPEATLPLGTHAPPYQPRGPPTLS